MATKDTKSSAPAGGVATPSSAAAVAPGTIMPAEKQAQARARLDAVIVAAVLALAFLLGSAPIRTNDFWMHLATGRLIVQGQYRPGIDPFSYATGDAYWVNHAWLFDLFTYLGYTAFGEGVGGPLLVLVKGLVVLGIAATMLAFRRLGQSLWVPAAVTGLALLVLAVRLPYQPILVSYLFLPLTLLVLHRFRGTRWLWLLVPLFVLWVNLDAWFFLGPAAAWLYCLGEAARALLDRPAEGGKKADRPQPFAPVLPLLLVTAVATAACLLNPHHVWAFTTLPVEVSVAGYARALAGQRLFESLFYTALMPTYYTREWLGLNVAGIALWPLLVAGLASFAFNYRDVSWTRSLISVLAPCAALALGFFVPEDLVWAVPLVWVALAVIALGPVIDARQTAWPRLLVWAAFGGLALWRVQTAGFFAVVSGPILVLNFQDVVARLWPQAAPPPRLEPRPALKSLATVAAVLAVFAVVFKTSLISMIIDAIAKAMWDVPGVSASLGLPDPPVVFLAFAVFTLTLLFFAVGPLLAYLADAFVAWSLGGRLLTVVAGVALLALAWPGGLTPDWNDLYLARRVHWAVEPDPSMKGVAQKLAEWRAEGLLPPDARGFNLHPALSNYLAWHCPGLQGFYDQRFPLFGDQVTTAYLDLRRALTFEDLKAAQPGPDGRMTEEQRRAQREAAKKLDALEESFRTRGVRFVVLTSEQRRSSATVVESAERLLLSGRGWYLIDLDGRSLVLSWHDPKVARDPKLALASRGAAWLGAVGGALAGASGPGPCGAALTGTNLPAAAPLTPDPLRALYLDPDRRAFEPQGEPAPDRAPPAPGSMTPVVHYMTPPPPRGLRSDEAGMYLEFFNVASRTVLRQQLLGQLWMEGVVPAAMATAAAPPAGPADAGVLLKSRYYGYLFAAERDSYLAAHASDENDPGLAILGVRAARRALADNPEDPDAYLRLAALYDALSLRTRERHWNQRGMMSNTRLLLETYGLPSAPLGSERMLPELGVVRRAQITAAVQQLAALAEQSPLAHDYLADVYYEDEILDLWVKHVETALNLRKAALPEDPKEREKQEDALDKEEKKLDARKRVLEQRTGQFVKDSAPLRTELDQAMLARAYGLVEKALDILLPLPKEKLNADVVRLQLELLLQTGRLDELTQRFCGPDRRLKPELRELLGKVKLPTGWLVTGGDWYALWLAAAMGDYAEADRALEAMLKEMPGHDAAVRLAAGAVGEMLAESLQPKLAVQYTWLRGAASALPEGAPGVLQDDAARTHLVNGKMPVVLSQQIRLAQADMIVRQRSNLLSLRGLLAVEAGDPAKARQYFREALAQEGATPEADSTLGSHELARYYLDRYESAGDR